MNYTANDTKQLTGLAEMVIKARVRMMHLMFGDNIAPAFDSWAESFRVADDGMKLCFYRLMDGTVRWWTA